MPTVQTRTLSSGKKRYYVRLRDPSRRNAKDPTRAMETSEVFDTKTEAQQFCNEVGVLGAAEAIARRNQAVTAAAGATVDELFVGYIAWKSTRVRSDRTAADYRRDYRNWIQPTFGGRVATSVTEQDVQAWVEMMIQTLSPKSVTDRHSLLHGVYSWAAREKKVAHNPTIGTDLPKRRKARPKGLRPAEWEALHIALRQIDDAAADLALFLISTGWRFSEAVALTTYDVEDYGDDVWVSVGSVLRRMGDGTHQIVEDTKTEKSQRRIKLKGDAARLVSQRSDAAVPGGLVFTTKGGARWHHSNFLHRAWEPAVKAANIPRGPTPHWLRHSHVTWLITSGKVSLAEVQKRIGHEHIETTIGVYGTLINDVSDDALAAIEQLISGPKVAVPTVKAIEG